MYKEFENKDRDPNPRAVLCQVEVFRMFTWTLPQEDIAELNKIVQASIALIRNGDGRDSSKPALEGMVVVDNDDFGVESAICEMTTPCVVVPPTSSSAASSSSHSVHGK